MMRSTCFVRLVLIVQELFLMFHSSSSSEVQKSLERILYPWAIRHPASGYVQGINDLVTPFLVVFLSEYFEGDINNWSMSDLSSDIIISNIEADCYWC
ncbi:TBC1 domain family member 22B [Glycine max]|uniref:TBC1 domain family member 22B n=1 Tax=Glycine max TaxID=3847 RepID=UPI000E21B910|nr:TBC1 domain family member 22B [Glycine max]|eukprot:XP_006600870.3 TBC1 domain family member 22B [Glycine max]